MADFIQLTNTILDAADTIGGIADKHITKQADLSTRIKNIQLQNDINGQLARIRQSSDYKNWNKDINSFFQQVKNGMSDPNSPYYCQNNLQAEMFTNILDQNVVNVSKHVNGMVMQKESEDRIVSAQNAKSQLAQIYSGQEYINEANELDRGLYESGDISIAQYQQQKDLNFKKAYEDLYIKTFDASLNDALMQNKSFESFYDDIKKSVPNLKATDTSGLEKSYDTAGLDEVIRKTCEQTYRARLSDIQKSNASSLSQIVQRMRQENTEEGKVNAARNGQMAMNRMKGLQLGETDRLQYSAIFELALGGENLKGKTGNGSGKGTEPKKSDFDSYEKFIKAAPETFVQLVKDGTMGNTYGAIQLGAMVLQDEWYNKDYQENYDKSMTERDETFNLVYKGATSEETLTNKMFDLLLANYPTAKDLVKDNYKNLITDIQKNPDKYGKASVGSLSEWMMDYILGADRYTTDDDFAEAFKKHINDCYAESIEYVELDKKGNLSKKYNANIEGDIAKAARLAQERDFVYTWQGQERWASGKKEALEAKGGIIDVLKNAVAGTLNIPENERGKIGFKYRLDEAHDDLTSTPIITYNGNDYEVIPDDDNKGFSIKNINTDEVIKGTTGQKAAKAQREEKKQAAKETEKQASQNTATIKRERKQELNAAIESNKTEPAAVKGSRKFEENEWNNTFTVEGKREKLNITATAIDKDSKKVEKKKMTEDEFKQKYGIKYTDWIKAGGEEARFRLILES